MKTHTKNHRLLVGVVALGTFAIMAAAPAAADPSASAGGSAQSGYNAIPSKVSGNVPSLSFESTWPMVNEFGDEVVLSGAARTLQSMSVVLSSWGCQSGGWSTEDCMTTPGATFDVPLTFTIYADSGGTAGVRLATVTNTVKVAYRPSVDTTLCTGGRWYNSKDRSCYNGFPQIVKMDMPSGVTLPSQVIWSVAYNTTSAGPHPIGVTACNSTSGGCAYDSLNIGAFSYPKAPFSGTDVSEDHAFVNGSMEAGWTGYRPLGAIVTK